MLVEIDKKSVSTLMWSWPAPTRMKSARDRSAFAGVQTAKFAHGVSAVTVPELDSVGMSVIGMRVSVPELDSAVISVIGTWMSVRRMSANMAADVKTRLDRTRVIVQGLGSPGHSVSSTSTNVLPAINRSAIITVSDHCVIGRPCCACRK